MVDENLKATRFVVSVLFSIFIATYQIPKPQEFFSRLAPRDSARNKQRVSFYDVSGLGVYIQVGEPTIFDWYEAPRSVPALFGLIMIDLSSYA